MQTGNKNKMMGEADNKSQEGKTEEFFFSGGLEYLPQMIQARNREEAEKMWLEKRKSRQNLSIKK